MRNAHFAAGGAAGPARSVPGAGKPVDLVHLARQTCGDADLEREVLRLFVTQSRLYLARLLGAADERQWLDAAHTIKGSARGIGAWSVADAAERAESVRFRKDSGGVVGAAAELRNEMERANRFIERLLAA